jgi:hypothetical protein
MSLLKFEIVMFNYVFWLININVDKIERNKISYRVKLKNKKNNNNIQILKKRE